MLDDFEDTPTGRSRLPMILGGVAIVVVAAIVGGVVWVRSGDVPADARTASAAAAPVDATPTASTAPETDRRVIGDWIYACAPDHCFVRQTLHYAGTPAVDLAWQIDADAKGALIATWTVPTNLNVRKGMLLDVGSGKSIAVPFESCTPTFCDVHANLAPDFVAILKKAPKLAASLTFRNDHSFTFQFSPKSFPEALDALSARPVPGGQPAGG